ncbi:hypothetical protein B0H10DRAFT_1946235 [Mycena sp. CBHHK59/15]|nr:hypothetical protein B0H10DRAFT_1946235 [Mycena sp. CBHHK59/15]
MQLYSTAITTMIFFASTQLGTDSAAKLINCSLTAVSRFFFFVADPQLVRNHCSKRSMVSSGLLLLTPDFWSQFQGADLNKSINSRSKPVCAVLRERNPTAITIDFGSHSISVTLSVFAAARTARMHVDFGQSVTHHLLQESTQACPENQRLCEFTSKCGFTTELALARSTILVGTARMQVDSGESLAHRLVGGSLNRPLPTPTSTSVNVSVLTSELVPMTPLSYLIEVNSRRSTSSAADTSGANWQRSSLDPDGNAPFRVALRARDSPPALREHSQRNQAERATFTLEHVIVFKILRRDKPVVLRAYHQHRIPGQSFKPAT